MAVSGSQILREISQPGAPGALSTRCPKCRFLTQPI